MSNLNLFSVKQSLNIESARGWQPRNAIDLSGQAHEARIIPTSCHVIEVYSDLPFYLHFDVATVIKTISSVEDNGSSQLQLNSSAHGLSNGNLVCLGGFQHNALHVMGIVANKTTNDFDITAIAWNAAYANDSGYAAVVTDTIDTNNHIYYPGETVIAFKVPWGQRPELDSTDKTNEHKIYEFTSFEKALIMHVKAKDNVASGVSLRYRET